MSSVDWGIVATVVVVLKGLWDILKERHKPALDLSSLEQNIANAANTSVKSLIETIAQMQRRMDTLETSDKAMRNEIQQMGQVIYGLRRTSERQYGIFNRLLRIAYLLSDKLTLHNIEHSEEREVIDQCRDDSEVLHSNTGPLMGGMFKKP